MCTQVSNGRFPAGFDAVTISKYVASYVKQQGIAKDQAPNAAGGAQLTVRKIGFDGIPRGRLPPRFTAAFHKTQMQQFADENGQYGVLLGHG